MWNVCSLTKFADRPGAQPSPGLNCWFRGPTLMVAFGAARVSSMQSVRSL